MSSKPSREILLRWLLAVGSYALLVYCFSPSWGAFRLWSRVSEMGGMLEVRRGVSVLAQIEHLGAPIADPLHQAIQWRLFFPVVGRVLGLPPIAFFALAHLGCLLVLGFSVTLLRRGNFNWTDTALGAIGLGAASWFFTSTGWLGYFDSWFALALLLVAFAETPWIVWLACLLGPWIDERLVIAAPLAVLCRWLHRPDRFDLRRDVGGPAALLALFVAVRVGVLAGRSSSGATVSGYFAAHDYLDAPLSRLALGVWEGLRIGWCFGGAAVVWLWPTRGRALAFGAVALVLTVAGLATAQDYSRAMTMLLPAAVLGLLLAPPAGWRTRALLLGTSVGLLLPAHHVMNDRVNPIYNLPHELAVLQSPPAIAMPELYELRAIHEMVRGEFAQADANLALAIKLSDNPASPARQRGVLAATMGKMDDALRYFSLAADHDPQDPDAWFMCAQAHLALGHAPDAHTAMERALTLAPSDWKTRPDVARFLVKLNATGK